MVVVVGPASRREGDRNRYWVCRCDCGQVFERPSCNLSKSRSCGCFARTASSKRNSTHRKCGTRIYRIWNGMMNRCHHSPHKDYAGKGISVCERWHTFENFYADMGDPPPRMSIDRIDTLGDYEPGNCRWATPKMQARNRSNNREITHQGETLCLSAWAERLGLNRNILTKRLNRGWTFERAISTPPQKGGVLLRS